MRSPHRWVLFGVCLGLGVLLSYGCGNDDKNPMNSGGGGGADLTLNIVADMGAGAFSPDPDTVTVGQTVSWKNNRSITHSSTANGSAWTVDIPAGGTSAPITMSTAGSFPYHCRFHPTMTATLVVIP